MESSKTLECLVREVPRIQMCSISRLNSTVTLNDLVETANSPIFLLSSEKSTQLQANQRTLKPHPPTQQPLEGSRSLRPLPCTPTPLGGSWVAISGVTSRITIVITPVRGLVTPLITTHEPPSKVLKCFYSATLMSVPAQVQQDPLRALNLGNSRKGSMYSTYIARNKAVRGFLYYGDFKA